MLLISKKRPLTTVKAIMRKILLTMKSYTILKFVILFQPRLLTLHLSLGAFVWAVGFSHFFGFGMLLKMNFLNWFRLGLTHREIFAHFLIFWSLILDRIKREVGIILFLIRLVRLMLGNQHICKNVYATEILIMGPIAWSHQKLVWYMINWLLV